LSKPILFLLKPGFYDGDKGPFFCPHTAALEGFIKFEPQIENLVDVRRIDFQRPRNDIVELLGEENQGSPVLVLPEGAELPPEGSSSKVTGRVYVLGDVDISTYLSSTYGLLKPH